MERRPDEIPNYVPVPVPEQHVSTVIALLAKLDAEGGIGNTVERSEPEQEPDEDLVRRMFFESERRHRKLLLMLADHPDEWLFSNEIAEGLGVASRKGMAGVFGAFGRRAKHRYGGRKPWRSSWDFDRNEAKYRMTPEVASWIHAAVREGGDSWT